MLLYPKPHFPPALEVRLHLGVRMECRLVGPAENRQVRQNIPRKAILTTQSRAVGSTPTGEPAFDLVDGQGSSSRVLLRTPSP